MVNILEETHTSQGVKLLLELEDKNQIEVAIFRYQGTEKNGVHICMPSQVGCPIGCKFCATTHSNLPYERNLYESEMNEVIKFIQTDFFPKTSIDVLSFSGHGEPLLNYRSVLNCINCNNATIKSVFLTTVGIKETMDEIVATGIIPGQFFFSLHGSTDEQRHLTVPDLPVIANLNQIRAFAKYLLSKKQTVTFNYMLSKETTTKGSADALFEYLSDIGNVSIRFTPVFFTGCSIDLPVNETVENFLTRFDSLSKNSTVSWRRSNPMGSEIGIACGQMRANARRYRQC